MAVTFTNNWKNILDKLRSVLRTEYGGTLPIYIGSDDSNTGTQYIRLDPVGSELTEYNTTLKLENLLLIFFMFLVELMLKRLH